jgi:hypothetical protein
MNSSETTINRLFPQAASTTTNIQDLTDTIKASMTIQDSSGLQIPLRVVWDTTFLGVAAEDTNLNLSCTASQTANQASATSPLPGLPSRLRSIPIVREGGSVAELRKNGSEPLRYALQRRNSYLIVHTPENLSQLNADQKARRADAAQRHIARRVPAPQPPIVGILSPQDALSQLKRLGSNEGPVLDTTKRIQSMTQKE